MKAYYEMTDAEKEIYEPMRAKVEALSKDLALYKFKSQLLELKWTVDSQNYEDVLSNILDYYNDFEDNYNSDLEYLIKPFHTNDDLEYGVKYLLEHFWWSHVWKAFSGIDDWYFHYFDETYNTYSNVDETDVDELINELLNELLDRIS